MEPQGLIYARYLSQLRQLDGNIYRVKLLYRVE